MSETLTEQDRALLALAADRHRPLGRAARIAMMNGGGLAAFGVLTILLAALEPDCAAAILGGVLLYVGVAERRAATRMRHGDLDAPRRLAINELILMGAIVTYGLLKLTVLRPNSTELTQAVANAMPDFDVEGLMDSMTTTVYATVIAVALLYQGGLARYFWRRKSDVARFNSEIPAWAREVAVRMSVTGS